MQMLLRTLIEAVAALPRVLGWSFLFYGKHAGLLLAVSAVPVVERMAWAAWGPFGPGLLGALPEAVVLVFRLLLYAVVVRLVVEGLKKGAASGGFLQAGLLDRASWAEALRDASRLVGTNLAALPWAVLLWHLLLYGLFFLTLNIAWGALNSGALTPIVQSLLGMADGPANTLRRVLDFAVRNAFIIPLSAVYLCTVFLRPDVWR